VNKENLNKLIGQLERLPEEKFDMRIYINHHPCGTTACIAGWCALLNGGPADSPYYFAKNFLGINEETARGLFINAGFERERFWPGTRYAQQDMTKDQILQAVKALAQG
jgi:hypothetical protein